MQKEMKLDFSNLPDDPHGLSDRTTWAVPAQGLQGEAERDELKRTVDKVLVRGIPPMEFWPTLEAVILLGIEVEFAAVFQLALLDEQSGPDKAAILADWHTVVSRILALEKVAYSHAPASVKAARVTLINSLEMQFITTVPAVRRQDKDAGKKLYELQAALNVAKLTT